MHSRTDTEQDDTALRRLTGCEYKTMHYLINRADNIGVSYPSQETIAEAIGSTPREVRRVLDLLNDNDVFRYRRKNAFDPITRRKLNNVYQVNPAIIAIAPEFEAEARSEWDTLINQCGNVSTGLWSPINQHQEPIPLTNSRTSTKNQHHQSAKTDEPVDDEANQREGADSGGGQKAKRQKQNPDGETGQRGAKTHQPAQPAEQTGSAGPGRYANPTSINTNLPDEAWERLASDLRKFGIAMPLARGFVCEYGYARTLAAYKAVQEMGDKARQPAAVFRSIVQIRLAEDFALAQQQIFNQRRG